MSNSDDALTDMQIKHFFEDLHLDEAKMESLLALSESGVVSPQANAPVDQSSRRRFLFAASFGGAAIAAGAGFALYQQQRIHRNRLVSNDVQLVTELVTNHRNRVPLDVTTSTIDEIAKTLNAVPFALKLPDRLVADADIVGARYCSLLGESAIQVRLKKKPTERNMTIFVAKANELLLHFHGVTTQTEDLMISAELFDDLLVTVVEER